MWSEGITPINVLHEYVSPTFIKQLRRVYGLLNSLRQYILPVQQSLTAEIEMIKDRKYALLNS